MPKGFGVVTMAAQEIENFIAEDQSATPCGFDELPQIIRAGDLCFCFRPQRGNPCISGKLPGDGDPWCLGTWCWVPGVSHKNRYPGIRKFGEISLLKQIGYFFIFFYSVSVPSMVI